MFRPGRSKKRRLNGPNQHLLWTIAMAWRVVEATSHSNGFEPRLRHLAIISNELRLFVLSIFLSFDRLLLANGDRTRSSTVDKWLGRYRH